MLALGKFSRDMGGSSARLNTDSRGSGAAAKALVSGMGPSRSAADRTAGGSGMKERGLSGKVASGCTGAGTELVLAAAFEASRACSDFSRLLRGDRSKPPASNWSSTYAEVRSGRLLFPSRPPTPSCMEQVQTLVAFLHALA